MKKNDRLLDKKKKLLLDDDGKVRDIFADFGEEYTDIFYETDENVIDEKLDELFITLAQEEE